MIWVMLLGGMAALLVVAWLKPMWFSRVWETTIKDLWVGAVGIFWAMLEYLSHDPTWQQVVNPEYVPYALIGMAVLGIVIRHINTQRN